MNSDALSPLPAAQGPRPPTNGPLSAAERLIRVRARIEAACAAAARAPDSVRLLAVSKTFDATEVLAVAASGQQAFGENYLQEGLEKIAACAGTNEGPALEWHFIGPIQSNKTRAIAEHFDWVHSIEREKIARRLSEQRPADQPPLQVCLQVDVSGEATKSGCSPEDAPALALAICGLPQLSLRGIMSIPAPSDDPQFQRDQFRRVRQVFEATRAALPEHAAQRFDTLSMGMSGDLEAAIAEGSTLVRVGTALFGSRAPRD